MLLPTMFQCVGVWISTALNLIKVFKGEVRPLTGHECLDGEYRFSSIFF